MSTASPGFEGHEKISTKLSNVSGPHKKGNWSHKPATARQRIFVGGHGHICCKPCETSFPTLAALESHQASRHGVKFGNGKSEGGINEWKK